MKVVHWIDLTHLVSVHLYRRYRIHNEAMNERSLVAHQYKLSFPTLASSTRLEEKNLIFHTTKFSYACVGPLIRHFRVIDFRYPQTGPVNR